MSTLVSSQRDPHFLQIQQVVESRLAPIMDRLQRLEHSGLFAQVARSEHSHSHAATTLHATVTRTQLDPPCPDFLTILTILLPSIEFLQAVTIAADLQRDFQNRKIRVSDLRLSRAESVGPDIPTIRWCEELSYDVIMFCKVADTRIPSSWLMLLTHAVPDSSLLDGDSAFIRVSVSDFAHLRELLVKAEGMLGSIQLSVDELLELGRQNRFNREK